MASKNLTAVGNITATSFNATSDYRIKENITHLSARFNVDSLNPVSYYNKNKEGDDIGFIAHEVQEIFPELVNRIKDGPDLQSINYNGLIPILVKEVQELKQNVKELQKEIQEIRNS